MAGKKPSMRKLKRRCFRGQSPQVQALLSDNFQWKVDTHMHTVSYVITSSKVTTDMPFPSVSMGLLSFPERGNQLCSLWWFSMWRSWKCVKRSDSCTNSKTEWKKSPHLGLEHVLQCIFHLFWQVDGGIVSSCYWWKSTQVFAFLFFFRTWMRNEGRVFFILTNVNVINCLNLIKPTCRWLSYEWVLTCATAVYRLWLCTTSLLGLMSSCRKL